jgi:hypothetical protein
MRPAGRTLPDRRNGREAEVLRLRSRRRGVEAFRTTVACQQSRTGSARHAAGAPPCVSRERDRGTSRMSRDRPSPPGWSRCPAARPGVVRLVMRTFVVVLLLSLVLPLAAAAQGGSTEQPPLVGYTRCGINFAGEDTWEIVTDNSGANLAVWSRGGLSCQAARRNAKRVRFNRSGAPVLAGYRCRSLRRALEYEVDRCIKRDGSGRGFRMAGGA